MICVQSPCLCHFFRQMSSTHYPALAELRQSKGGKEGKMEGEMAGRQAEEAGAPDEPLT